jgi:hypothetical protein
VCPGWNPPLSLSLPQGGGLLSTSVKGGVFGYGECPEACLCFRHTTAAKPVPNNNRLAGSGVVAVEYRKLNVSA